MAPTLNFPWTRYWHRRGDRPTLANGYLVPSGEKFNWSSPRQAATLMTLSDLGGVPCLVLLGEPGTGKSTEIAAETVRLGATPTANFTVKRLDLKLRTESLIEKLVFCSEEFLGWTEGRHELALFFDSMDECWRRVPELARVIVDVIEPYLTKKLPPLRLRFGCRAAEWRDEIEGDLRRVFGEKSEGEKVQVWELAPLTEDDVRVAATACGLDHKFVAEVREREVNAFAADPITLGMLLATAKEGGALGRDRAEIYQKGCMLLCRDRHQDEKASPRLVSTAQQRLACASYLAAVGILSNRYLVFGSSERRPEDETGTVAADDLLGRMTRLPEVDVEITRELLAETLQTSLFDVQSGSLFSWRHQSYAEYLAARYIQLRQIPPVEVAQSLCDTTSGLYRLWPQVEETACWLAMLMPEVFDRLVVTNAEVFVRCDPARLEPERRAQIVAAYLVQVRKQEAVGEQSRLDRLAHPGLAQQLATPIADRNEDIYVRGLAIDIARACELLELVDALIGIMFTPVEPEPLRRKAGAALQALANSEIRAKVRARLAPEALENDDVRGYALAILWPGSLTEDELVSLLEPPTRNNYVGMYQIFLADRFRYGLVHSNLVPLIRWARRIGVDSEALDDQPLKGAASAVLLEAFRSIEIPDVREGFMLALQEQVMNHRPLFKCEGRDITKEEAQRRVLWSEVVAGDFPVWKLVTSYSIREAGLAHEDDFGWVIDCARAAAPRDRDRWLDLAFWLFRPMQRPEQIDQLRPFAESSKAVAERLLQHTTCALFEANGEPNWQKAHFYREEKRKAERASRKPFRLLIEESLAGYETTEEPRFIWELVHRLNRPVMDPDEEGFHNSSDVGWKHLSDEHRARILAFAPTFLPSVAVNSTEVYDKKKCYWNYVAGVSFLIDLVESGSTWPDAQPAAFWEAWSPAIVQYQERVYHVADSSWQRTLKLAFERAKAPFIEAIRRWLAERTDRWLPTNRFELLPIGSDTDLEDLFLTSALGAKRDSVMDFDFFAFLLQQRSVRTEEVLNSWLPQQGIDPHDNGPFADALLLCCRPVVHAIPAIDRILKDAEWGRRVLLSLVTTGGVRSNWVDLVDSDRLIRVWEFIDREFPGDPYDNDSDGTVTAAHEIAIFRSHLLSYIQKRGTAETEEAFRALLLRHPGYRWLGNVLAHTRQIVRRESWQPPAAVATIGYLARTGTPPLCSDADLADAVKVSLARYQMLLRGPNPPTELWNESAGPVRVWTPKDEENVSDCLARHLERDLMHHQVVVARESELRQGTPKAPGDEPDLRITAPTASDDGGRLLVIVEVKCSWNKETVTGLEQQLLNRYLRGVRCGIYVVAHFNCASWSDTDARKKQMFSAKSVDEVVALLEGERQRLVATTAKRLELVVIDASV